MLRTFDGVTWPLTTERLQFRRAVAEDLDDSRVLAAVSIRWSTAEDPGIVKVIPTWCERGVSSAYGPGRG